MSNLSSRLELILNNSHHTIIAPLLWALSLHAQINLSENLYKKIYQIINTCSENFTISDCALISQTLLNIKYQISPHDLEENALGRIYKNGQIFENKYMSVNNKWYLDNYGYDIHQLFIQAMKSQLENFREKQFIEEYILDNLYVLPLFSQKYKIAYILVNKFDFIENGERNGNIYILRIRDLTISKPTRDAQTPKPKTPKPQNPKNPKTPKPQNPKTPKCQNPKIFHNILYYINSDFSSSYIFLYPIILFLILFYINQEIEEKKNITQMYKPNKARKPNKIKSKQYSEESKKLNPEKRSKDVDNKNKETEKTNTEKQNEQSENRPKSAPRGIL